MNSEIKNATYTRGQQNKTAPSNKQSDNDGFSVKVPSIEFPKGGGAIKGIEEKFQANAVSGASSFGIPIPFSPSRHEFIPAIGLSYNSGSGNSSFGLGWEINIPTITRKTEKQLPQYKDEEESDTFILSEAEDLIPFLEEPHGEWIKYSKQRIDDDNTYAVTRYRPRIEGLFAVIERWENINGGDTHWRTITKDNIHSYYGLDSESRISDPQDESRIFKWLLCRTHDDKGSIAIYHYKKEDFVGVPQNLSEKNKINNCSQIYIKKILYGNRQPYYAGDALPVENDFLFKVVFDYGEHDAALEIPKDIHLEKDNWKYRKDAFSFYRSGFEIRTYRRCSRILVFHCFDAPDLPHTPYLTKSLELFYDDDIDLIGNSGKIQDFSYLVKARQNGHKWDATANHYLTKHLPDLDFPY